MSGVFTVKRMPTVGYLIFVALVALIDTPILADDEIKPNDRVALVMGYGHQLLRADNRTEPERETLNSFLQKTSDALRKLSVVDAKMIAEGVIAKGIRLQHNESKNEDALITFLKNEKFTHAILADIITKRQNEFDVQLYLVKLDTYMSDDDVHEFGNQIELDTGMTLDKLGSNAAREVKRYLGKYPTLRTNKVVYVTCIHYMSSNGELGEFLKELDYGLTYGLHDMKTGLGKAYNVQGLKTTDLPVKCFPEHYEIPQECEMEISGRVEISGLKITVVLTIEDSSGDTTSYDKIEFGRELHEDKEYEDRAKRDKFKQDYIDGFQAKFSQCWNAKYGSARGTTCQ